MEKKKLLKPAIAVVIIGLVSVRTFMYISKKVTSKAEINHLVEGAISDWQKSPEKKWDSSKVFQINSNVTKDKSPIVFIGDLLSTDSAAVFKDLEAVAEKQNSSFSISFYPLDQHCNSAIDYRSDGLSCRLTAAVMCAQTQMQKGLELTKFIYAENKNMLMNPAKAPAILEDQFPKLSLNPNQMNECIKSTLEDGLIQTSNTSIQKISFTRLPVILYKDKIYNAPLMKDGLLKLVETNP
ncbi:MAG: hypothetical protein K2Q18_07705 [Bdellovibrionales bacterium]|nr:hypothetical protein [Bdellovibrionales bacterium]